MSVITSAKKSTVRELKGFRTSAGNKSNRMHHCCRRRCCRRCCRRGCFR